MKIHFIISSLGGGGAERVMALLANNLSKRKGYDVNVITLNKGKEAYEMDKNVQRVMLSHGKIPNHSIRSFVNLFRFYFKKQNRPDVIISFMTLTNLVTIPIAKLYGIKIVVQEQNNYLTYMKSRKFLSDFTKKVVYKKADLLTVLTSFDFDFYQKYGINVMVIPNPTSFKPFSDKNSSRENVILAVGSLDRYHHKGFDNLIPLIKPVLKSNPDWKLKIVGSGNKGLPFLSDLVNKNELEDQIIFTGFLDNVSKIMQRSSIFVLSSRFEGMPLVLLEAMSQGMACIAYNCKTGPSDLIQNEKNGLLIEDQNKEQMSEQLMRLIDNNDLRDSLGSNAAKSLDNHHIDVILDDFEKIFKSLLN